MRKRDIIKEFFISFRCIIGPFGSLFRRFPHYLPLLTLENHQDIDSPINLDLSLKKINKEIKSKSVKDIDNAVKLLLNSINWRNHLVGCIVIIKINKENQQSFIERLWDICLNKNSWVLPQILATLSIIDSEFQRKVKSKEIKEAFLNNKMVVKEIELLLHSKNRKKYPDEEPYYGLSWKNNLIGLIKEGKL